MAEDGRDGLYYQVLNSATGEPPHPAIILLHGRGANEVDLLSLGPELDPRLTVVSPRAPHPFGPGSYYWYDLEAEMTGRPTLEHLRASLEQLTELVDSVLATMPLDPKRLFVGGFSMGGAMTAAMMLTQPSRFAGAMILSGYVPIHSQLEWDVEGVAGKSVFQAHGTYDPVLPIQYGRMSRDFLAGLAVDLTYREYPMAHQVSAPELVDGSAWIQALL